MARWTGEWLSTLSSTRTDAAGQWPGEHLGLPEKGPNSVAPGGRRLLALLLDLVIASLLTSLFIQPQFQNPAVMQEYNLVALGIWVLVTVVPVALFGATAGMTTCGIGVARLGGAQFVGVWRALVRCALTAVIIPAAIRDGDGRGWHDRLTGTVVVRLR